MLAHGDELGRTQDGNNNVYAQDNELSWIDWDLEESQSDLMAFTAAAIALRREHPVFRRRDFLVGDPSHGGASSLGEIEWFQPDAVEMSDSDWNQGYARALMVFLNGDAIPEKDHRGQRVTDDRFVLMFNAHSDAVTFTLPPQDYGTDWVLRLDTATGRFDADDEPIDAGATLELPAHSMLVLSATAVPEASKQGAAKRADAAARTSSRASLRD